MADGNYASVAQVKALKVDGAVVGLSAFTDAEIGDEIALVEELIEKLTNDIFYTKTETNYFDGNKDIALFFAPRVAYQLISVTTCKDVDIDGTVLETFTENDDFVKYSHSIEVSTAWSGDRPRRGVFRGGVWPFGQKNIEVAGTWGRATVPAAIKRVTIWLTLEKLVPGSTNMSNADVSQISWPDFTMSVRGDLFGKLTGYVEVDRILEDYMNFSDMFMFP
jgi:hypothetical protein